MRGSYRRRTTFRFDDVVAGLSSSITMRSWLTVLSPVVIAHAAAPRVVLSRDRMASYAFIVPSAWHHPAMSLATAAVITVPFFFRAFIACQRAWNRRLPLSACVATAVGTASHRARNVAPTL